MAAYLEALNGRSGSQRIPVIQAVHQHQLWTESGDNASADDIERAITRLSAADAGFNMEGASWTNNLSWVEGYANVLGPMNQLSAQFHALFDQAIAREPSVTCTEAYRESLLHVLLLETSCFRYWGQGAWTGYAQEIHRRGRKLLGQRNAAALS